MKIGNIIYAGRTVAAIQTVDGIIPVGTMDGIPEDARGMTTDDIILHREILQIIQDSINNGEVSGKVLTEARFAPVVTKPEKILCIGLNYRPHVEETNDKIPDTPVIFSKFSNSLAASGETILIPEQTRQLDYEGELGMVIGKEGKNISEKNALDHVWGYFAGNDLSARDLQFRTSQWLLGKSCDHFYPCGPFITTADEIEDPQNLTIRTYFNDEIRQNSNTSRMIFSCAYLVSYISRFMTLHPGDIISTGTPEGVILGMPEEERRWISPGDHVRVEIEKLGKLENTFS